MEYAALHDRLVRVAAGMRHVQPDGDLATDVGALLLSCASPSVLAASLAERAGALSPASWGYAITLAEEHGVVALLYSRLAGSGLLEVVPSGAHERITQEYRRSVANSLLVRSCLRAVLAAAANGGCEVIALKGTLLAQRYYESITLRPARDVDVLVARADAPRLDTAIQRLGYVPSRDKGRVTHFAALATAEVKYVAPNKPMIEGHWGLSQRVAYRGCLPVAEAASRSVTLDFDDLPARVLDTPDELAFLCVHCAADHDETRLIWLVDLARIVSRLPDEWDWVCFVDWVTARGLATPMVMALGEAVLCLDAPVPDTVLAALLDAAGSAAESNRWRSSRASMLSRTGMMAHLRELRSTSDRIHFLWGAAPRALRAGMRGGMPARS